MDFIFFIFRGKIVKILIQIKKRLGHLATRLILHNKTQVSPSIKNANSVTTKKVFYW